MPKRFPRYERLLRLYPRAYREQYGGQMMQTLGDMLDDAATPAEKRLVWIEVAMDYPVSAARSQRAYIGGIMQNETPKYVKETGLLTGLLVLPFFAALAANGLDKVINNHALYNSWLWRMPFIGAWALWLPAIAFVLTVLGLGIYAFKPSAKTKASWFKRALDVKHAWPIMAPGLLAFGILFLLAFHDSAHCWVQDPAYFVTRFHQTYQCTASGFIGG